MFRIISPALAVLISSTAALAQVSVEQLDPRVAPAALRAMQALLDLRQAEIAAITEDDKKRADYWKSYVAGLPPPPKAK